MSENILPAHGGQLRELAAEFNVPEDSLLDFSASIHPHPPSDIVVAALCNALRAGKILTTYPDMHYAALKEEIAEYANVSVSAISIGSGVMPLLGATVSALRLRRCLVPVPSFAEYRLVLSACGAECRTLTVTPNAEFFLDSAQVIAELKTLGTQAILLANPQSPSGRLMPAKELLQLHDAVSKLGITMIVDEAFIDYAPEESLSQWAAKLSGLIVLRSLTKFFAMPGLRVAYAIACPEMRVSMESCVPAWPVGSIAAEAACMVLRDHASITATREMNARERGWLREQLQSLRLRVFPGAANYLLVKIDENISGPELWRRLILEHRVVIRSCANFEGLDEHYFRVAVRTRVDNQRLLDAFAAVLRSTPPKCPEVAER
jgi:threonine-phosphate decarboxylase